MDIFFQDPTETPLPPGDVRIREFKATPWGDGRRVRIYLEVDPFQKRPSAEVAILNEQQEVMAEVSIIESMTRKIEFNMHLRHANLAGKYSIEVKVYYDNSPVNAEGTPVENQEPPQVVDQRKIEIEIKE
jgi:hypothetical protein